jgi:hypothetical protein
LQVKSMQRQINELMDQLKAASAQRLAMGGEFGMAAATLNDSGGFTS